VLLHAAVREVDAAVQLERRGALFEPRDGNVLEQRDGVVIELRHSTDRAPGTD
jgi:hypothetical protein